MGRTLVSGSVREIETAADLEAAIAASDRHRPSMRGWQVQDLDVHRFEERLTAFDPRGSLFLGAGVSDAFAERLRAGGALVFPRLPDLPFDPWRSALYTPGELYADLAEGYAATPDARIYAWSRSRRRRRPAEAARRRAARQLGRRRAGRLRARAPGRRRHGRPRAAPRRPGVRRGGAAGPRPGRHGAHRGDRRRTRRDGGRQPGRPARRRAGEVLERAVEAVAGCRRSTPDVTAWATLGAWARCPVSPTRGRSLGIPTWHYGHEPPNAFASAVAKYFRNAIREDVLLQVCGAGIVFLPGAAGTVQEVFQAACTNFYAEADTSSPMVFVGEHHWTEELPVWPLVRRLGAGRPLAGKLQLVDDAADVVAALVQE